MDKVINKDTKPFDISIIKMAQVELPKFEEPRYNDWVNYGSDNLFPVKLIDLANRSALHNAIVSSKVDHTCGGGFTYEKKKDSKTDKFIENPNPNESLEDVYRKITYDLVLFGGYCLNIILSKDKKSIAEIYHVPFNNIRCGKADKTGFIDTYYYSRDWANYKKEGNEPEAIKAYKDGSKEASQLIYVKEYMPGVMYYPLPSYVGAMAYIEIDTEIANFHLAHIKNGMTPSIMINFNNGIPSPDERKKIEKQLARKYQGSDNAGNFILSFSEDKTKAPDVITLSPSQLDKQFIQLQDTVLQNILSGHKVTSPLLVGIKTEGQLGGTTELMNAYQIYTNTVIVPLQNLLMRTIDKITQINGLQELEIIKINPVEFTWEEGTLAQIMTKTEMRERIGLDPIETPQLKMDFFAPKFIDINTDFSRLKESDLDKRYVWDINEDESDACPACKEHFNRGALTLREWFKIAIPGKQNNTNFGIATTDYKDRASNEYGTFCENTCRCRLIKVSADFDNE